MVSSKNERQYERTLFKLVPIPGLVFTSVLAFLPLVWNVRGDSVTGDLVGRVTSHRDSIAFAVQIVSMLLGIIDTFALQITLGLSARHYWEHRSFPLYMIKFINGLQSFIPDWTIPWKLSPVIVILFVVGQVPGALWAGAITPILTTQNSTQAILLPGYTDTTFLTLGDPPSTTNDYGIFEYQPQYLHQGPLLDGAASASKRRNQTAVIHAKLDNTGYSYINRSYGVGASVGLTDHFSLNTTAYHYYEVGVQPEVSCIFNSSSNVVVDQWQDVTLTDLDDKFTITLWAVSGTLPSGYRVPGTAAASVLGEAALFVASGSQDDLHYVSFATVNRTHNYYQHLYQAQCQITFAPRNFSVAVDVSNRTITVQPVQQLVQPPMPLGGDLLVLNSSAIIGYISGITSTSIYTSPMGNAFLNNINNVRGQANVTSAMVLQGLAESVASIIDSTLVVINSAQIVVQQSTLPTSAVVSASAVAFGTSTYIYLLVAAHLFICLVYLEEILRTRFWCRLTAFTFRDPTDLLVSASGGSTAIHKAATRSKSGVVPTNDQIESLSVTLKHELDGGLPIMVLDQLPAYRKTSSATSLGQEGPQTLDVIPLQQRVGTLTDQFTRPGYHRLESEHEQQQAS